MATLCQRVEQAGPLNERRNPEQPTIAEKQRNPHFLSYERSVTKMKTEIQEVLDSINGTVNSFVTNQKSMQKQLDAIDLAVQSGNRLAGGMMQESYVEKFKNNDGVQQILKNQRGNAIVNLDSKERAQLFRKATITESGQGFAVTGVMPIERIPGITPEARQTLFVRDLLPARPTTMAIVDFVRVTTPLSIASPVPESSTKPENQLSFTSFSERVRTIAHWLPASKQILDDFGELMGFISTSMPYYTNLAEELQLLSGDGTGENLHGLIPQAQVFNSALLPSGGTKIDTIGAAIEQVEVAKELPPTFAVLHPADWWAMKLLKNTLGNYILGDPQAMVQQRIFDLDVVPTTSIAKGTFLVGSGDPVASEIRDRMEMQVEISTEHANFFIQNLVAVRAEKRLALVVKRPASFITGAFTS